MPTNIPTQKNNITGLNIRGANVLCMLNDSNSRGIDKKLVSFSFVHHLCVSRYNLNTRIISCFFNGLDDSPKDIHFQTFFNNKPDTQKERTGPTHGQVIHRSVYSKGTDISAGKEQGPDHIGVCRKRTFSSINRKDRGVMSLVCEFIFKFKEKHFFNELVGQRPSSPMGQ